MYCQNRDLIDLDSQIDEFTSIGKPGPKGNTAASACLAG